MKIWAIAINLIAKKSSPQQGEYFFPNESNTSLKIEMW